ncbi:MAG: hypothetical protein CL607_28435 [Anaerolineaceae bacterium]|nr:hypothetical protein [Anaerolineaceae bacterium]
MLKVHRLGFVLGVIILLFGVSSTVWGQRGDWFEEEFDHRMPRGDWDYSDNWRVSSGVARTTSDGGFMYYPGPYDDMVLHTRLRWEADDGRVGVFFRAQDEGTIIFVLFPDGMQLEVPIAGTEDVDVLDDTPQHPGDGWHDVILWAQGEDLVVIFDWEFVFEERIDDHEGGLGIFVDGEGPLEVDFFRVGPMEPLEDLFPNNVVPSHDSADNDDTSNSDTSSTDTSSPGVSSTQTSGSGDNDGWETDVAITDLFLESAGQMNMRITNHGPKVMNNVNVPVQCEAFGSNDSGAQTHRPPVNWVFTMSAAPGQTETFMTNWTLDRNAYMWTVYCHTNTDYDADTSNTEYSESFEQPQPQDNGVGDAHIPQSDLAVTDIYPQSMPQGTIFVRVTNNGPEAINSDVGLACTAKISGDPNNPDGTTASVYSPISVNLQPGVTEAFHSGLMVNDTNTYQYDIICTVNAGIFDPVPDNNSYNEIVP